MGMAAWRWLENSETRAGLEIQIWELRAGSVFRILGLDLVWTESRKVGGKTGTCAASGVMGRKCSMQEGGINSVKCH